MVAWHEHDRQTDYWYCCKGTFKVGLADGNFDESVEFAFLGAWNFAKEIKKKEEWFINRGGKFITHVPIVRFV